MFDVLQNKMDKRSPIVSDIRDVLETFKPNPDVYRYFMKEAGDSNDAWLISGNPFDVIGAVTAGMKSAWVKRSDRAVFDPWGIEPTVTVATLRELCEKLDIKKT